jgi:serine phosphatase RsbU (regulator of sigma subunit)/CheY-like chemotaxis protein
MSMSEPIAAAPASIEVFIVEDSPTQALKLRHVLERHEYRVTAARNGKEALAVLAERLPTLMITDINMPEMDGYELCQRIKDDPRMKELPVILLTSLSDPKDILRGLECGADNFIVKPYNEEFLLSRIQYVMANLELRRQSKGKLATEIFFAGQKYRLTSERIHSIDLLLSTYETAVQKNMELSRAKEQLELQAEQLREKNAQMEADLDMARELQVAFLPRHYPVFPPHASPDQSALQFCHRYSTSTELGGDFFDVLALSDTMAGILICDVMGHGVRAALVTAIVRGLVEELREDADDPGELMTQMNRSLCAILQQTTTPLFATAVYAVVDAARGVVRWANAGHPAPYHLRRSAGVVERLVRADGKKADPALGLMNDTTYHAEERRLSAGDLLMLFTDGLYEIDGADDTLYEVAQLTSALDARLALPTTRLFDELIAELRKFSVTGEFGDDMCLVGLDVARLLAR